MQSDASTVEEYLAELAPDRREIMTAVRDTVNSHLPTGYMEGMGWGMITWSVPLERYPNTYNGQPLGYLALASQKRHLALYLTCVYSDPEAEQKLRQQWAATGRKLNMGKSCLRFQRLEDLDLDIIAELVAATSVDDFLSRYEAARQK
ncbi:MAG: DUF1801 domain-containing protein [Pseudonocardiaceae bacterium]